MWVSQEMCSYAGQSGDVPYMPMPCSALVYKSLTMNALFKSGFVRNFHQWIVGTVEPFDCWECWANHLKSRLQSNHVPVHRTHSAKVIK
jgi:hypothetical protein